MYQAALHFASLPDSEGLNHLQHWIHFYYHLGHYLKTSDLQQGHVSGHRQPVTVLRTLSSFSTLPSSLLFLDVALLWDLNSSAELNWRLDG